MWAQVQSDATRDESVVQRGGKWCKQVTCGAKQCKGVQSGKFWCTMGAEMLVAEAADNRKEKERWVCNITGLLLSSTLHSSAGSSKQSCSHATLVSCQVILQQHMQACTHPV